MVSFESVMYTGPDVYRDWFFFCKSTKVYLGGRIKLHADLYKTP